MTSWSNLASIVYRRTYSRRDTGQLENWNETVERVVHGNVRGHNVPDQEVKALLRLARERKAIPAGRGLWFSGSPSHEKIGGIALNNCWALDSSDWNSFVLAQDLLMLGGGVGLSVEHKYVSKLPRVRKDVEILHKPTKDADFIVPDSREGWCELLRRVLESFFVTGRSFTYSTICVRGAGELIHGFGGISSGPLPIVQFVRNLVAIIGSRGGRHIRPIDAADIICATGEMVVSGNVRRSAIIILGDAWDKEYLRAKRWDLGVLPSYRSCANFSVVCDDIEDLHPWFWKTYEQGEPFGLINRKNIQRYGRMGEEKRDTAYLTNPCVVAGTKILTLGGEVAIEYCVDQKVSVWNGHEWSEVRPQITGYDQPVVTVTLSNGRYLTCTPAHRFVLAGNRKVAAGSLQPGDVLQEFVSPYDNWVPTDGPVKVVNMVYVGIADRVYCFTEPKRHQGTFNGIVTGQCGEATLEHGESCNLQEIALMNIEDEAEFTEAARLMHRYGKRVTMERYGNGDIEEVVYRNRRIGTGITGCLGSPLFKPEILDGVYAAIQKENVSYSRELGIPQSIRTTVVKPGGTVPKLLDQGGYEGIHAAFSRHMIQRIRFSSNDALLPVLKAAGHFIEPVKNLDGTINHGTQVVDFYLKAPDGLPVADEDWDTWKQLDTLKMAQRHWADQAVSVTVYYRKEEIPKLKAWLVLNYKELKTVSFLCHNDHGFLQAPKEAITAEQYEKLSAKVKPIDINQVGEGDMESLECEGGACPVK